MTRDINSVIKEFNTGKPERAHFKPIEALLAPDTKGLIDEYNAGVPQNMHYSPYLTTLYVVVPKYAEMAFFIILIKFTGV
jgi:hypothetical protein